MEAEATADVTEAAVVPVATIGPKEGEVVENYQACNAGRVMTSVMDSEIARKDFARHAASVAMMRGIRIVPNTSYDYLVQMMRNK